MLLAPELAAWGVQKAVKAVKAAVRLAAQGAARLGPERPLALSLFAVLLLPQLPARRPKKVRLAQMATELPPPMARPAPLAAQRVAFLPVLLSSLA